MKMTGHFDPDAASRRCSSIPEIPPRRVGVWMNLRPLVGIIAAESLVLGGEPREWNEKEADEESLSAEGDEGAGGFDEVAYVFGQFIALRIEPV